MTGEQLKKFWLQSLQSEKIQLDNLDWARLVFDDRGNIVVENEHGTHFDVESLSQDEIDIFYANI